MEIAKSAKKNGSLIVLAYTMFVSANSFAQSTQCPPGMIPGQGRCLSPTENFEPVPVYESRYGAIAFQDNAYGNFASAYAGAHSKEEARRIALTKCGEHCEILFEVRNQCMAVAHDSQELSPLGFGASRSPKRSAKEAIKECKKRGGTDCAVQHLSCSFPERVR